MTPAEASGHPLPDNARRVGVLGQLPAGYAAEITRRFPELRLVTAGDDAIDVLIAWALDVPRVLEQIDRQPRLEWIHLRWAGVPSQVLEALGERTTIVTNGSGAHGPAIAEYVLCVTLAHYKRLHDMRAAQIRSVWLEPVRLRELRGSLAGIIGLGDLGTSIARL